MVVQKIYIYCFRVDSFRIHFVNIFIFHYSNMQFFIFECSVQGYATNLVDSNYLFTVYTQTIYIHTRVAETAFCLFSISFLSFSFVCSIRNIFISQLHEHSHTCFVLNVHGLNIPLNTYYINQYQHSVYININMNIRRSRKKRKKWNKTTTEKQKQKQTFDFKISHRHQYSSSLCPTKIRRTCREKEC